MGKDLMDSVLDGLLAGRAKSTMNHCRISSSRSSASSP